MNILVITYAGLVCPTGSYCWRMADMFRLGYAGEWCYNNADTTVVDLMLSGI